MVDSQRRADVVSDPALYNAATFYDVTYCFFVTKLGITTFLYLNFEGTGYGILNGRIVAELHDNGWQLGTSKSEIFFKR